MDLIFIYLIGCLLGFGISSTIINFGYNRDSGLSNFQMRFYGTISSWLTVIFLLYGVIRSVVKGGNGKNGGDAG